MIRLVFLDRGLRSFLGFGGFGGIGGGSCAAGLGGTTGLGCAADVAAALGGVVLGAATVDEVIGGFGAAEAGAPGDAAPEERRSLAPHARQNTAAMVF